MAGHDAVAGVRVHRPERAVLEGHVLEEEVLGIEELHQVATGELESPALVQLPPNVSVPIDGAILADDGDVLQVLAVNEAREQGATLREHRLEPTHPAGELLRVASWVHLLRATFRASCHAMPGCG